MAKKKVVTRVYKYPTDKDLTKWREEWEERKLVGDRTRKRVHEFGYGPNCKSVLNITKKVWRLCGGGKCVVGLTKLEWSMIQKYLAAGKFLLREVAWIDKDRGRFQYCLIELDRHEVHTIAGKFTLREGKFIVEGR